MAALLSGLATAAAHGPAAAAAPPLTHLTCEGAILGFQQLGDHRLASYQDAHGHRIELWCTRRVFDSQFDLRVAVAAPAHGGDGRPDPVAPGRLATVGGCFFDNGDNQGPIFVVDPGGGYVTVAWVTQDPADRRKYRFSYDFASKLVTVTATVAGCAPVSKVVAPQPSYRRLAKLLPHPETQSCALPPMGGFNPTAPTP